MKFQGKFEWTDYMNAQLLHTKQPAIIQVMLYIVLVSMGVMFLGGLWLSITGRISFEYILPPLIVLVVFVLYRFLFLPRQVRRIFAQTKELSLPVEYEIKELGLQTTNEHGSGLRPWQDFVKWKEDNNLLMLYVSDKVFIMLPKRFFVDPQQIESIRAHLTQSKVPIARYLTGRTGMVIPAVLILLILAAAVCYYSYYTSMAGGG